VIDDEAELRYWRNSYGLLGFITSLEFDLDYRPKFQAIFKKREVLWNEEEFWSFLKQDASADISEEDAPAGRPGDRQALMGQFFFDPYKAGKTGWTDISAVIWRANENATEPGYEDGAPAGVEGAYEDEMAYPNRDEILSTDPQNGGVPVEVYTGFNEVIKHWGGPKVLPLGYDMNDLLAHNARLMVQVSMSGPQALIWQNRRAMNDGFYASKVPNVVYGAYFMKPSQVFKAWDILKDNFMARENDTVFPWNGPPELRFLEVTDDAILNPVPAGVYAVSEYLGFPTGRSDQGWKSAFKHVQDEWGDKLGGKPHIGKFWGFGTADDGTVQPYQPDRACRIYSDAAKNSFEAYRRQADPDNLFAGGDAMKLLSGCQ